jgi:hypothetical protein
MDTDDSVPDTDRKLQTAANKTNQEEEYQDEEEEEEEEEEDEDAVEMEKVEEQSAACDTDQSRMQQHVAMEETDLADAPESEIEEQEEPHGASPDLSQTSGRGSKRQAPALSRIETAVATLAASQPHHRFRPQVRASLTSDGSGVLVASRLPGVTAQHLSLRLSKPQDKTSPILTLCGLRDRWQPERQLEHDPFMALFGGYNVRPRNQRTRQWFHEQIDLSLPVSIARAFQITQNQAAWQVRLGRDGSLNMFLPFERRHKTAAQARRRDEDVRRDLQSGQYRRHRHSDLFGFPSPLGGQRTDYFQPALFGF